MAQACYSFAAAEAAHPSVFIGLIRCSVSSMIGGDLEVGILLQESQAL